MLFGSPLFLFLYLPFSLITYFLTPKIYKNILLLILSIFFYSFSEGKFVFFILMWTLANFISGIIIDYAKSEKVAKFYLVSAVIMNLGVLYHFKYTYFFLQNLKNVIPQINIGNSNIYLPLAISFFTFHAISYNFDIFRKENRSEKNIIRFFLYMLLFPHLLAGPIIRYHHIKDQLKASLRTTSFENISYGIKRFTFGLAKKVLIADTLALSVNEIFAISPLNISSPQAWLGIFMFGLQIYFDFSGYSDMAIGLGRMFGFTFPENFNYPYISRSITEFWQRWHISLSSWFKDYLYIPLGGNRKGFKRSILNVWIVFLLTGFWHGANWNFIFWGGFFAFFITLEKIIGRFITEPLPTLFKIPAYIYSLLIVFISWVFFRAESFSFALLYLKRMVWIEGGDIIYHPLSFYLRNDVTIALLVGIILSLQLHHKILDKITAYFKRPIYKNLYNCFQLLFFIFVLLLSMVSLASQTYQSFIYFRF